ncbi:M20/M25/M40 family metallo-hydrolase [Flavisphingomonas formosensis]|uniref:M20/M25/M40 family metallo-hydrolase n=1 Tax=Flavisphingomonas formosensis TaxID=861534 RepID=UPI0012F7752A|nr:M20/M25/M40 family metallo-hydrolase [Sphingomonas formosensis]
MKKVILLAAAVPMLVRGEIPEKAAALRDSALQDEVAWSITEGLTTEVGQRLAATEAEARARDWAVARLKALGFSNVRIEPFTMDGWVRGEEKAEIISPFPQRLIVAALGGSASTGSGGITAQIVGFPSLDALKAASPDEVKGKIVFVWHRMQPTQDGSGYGMFGPIRWYGASVASKKGAAAIIIRSIGTDHHRIAHVGSTNFEAGVKPIPAGALSVPDADNLERMLARGKPVSMRLTLTPQFTGPRQSGNVVAEVPGRDPTLPMILIGGHLDSWDLGTGAIDDAAGIAITTAAAKRIMDAGRPLRTIRVVWFGAEEEGGLGAEAYFKAHGSEAHALVGESDFGADRIWQFKMNTGAGGNVVKARIGALLAPLGIVTGSGEAHAGTDVEPVANAGAGVLGLNQDGTHYFELHHTPDDTLDKIDPEALRQNVAAWTAALAVAADSPDDLRAK